MNNYNSNTEKKRWKKSDNDLFFNVVDRYKSIITNKKTDALCNRKKESAWQNIESEYNASAFTKKDVSQLKIIYRNRLAALRKVVAQENAERHATGGGPFKPRISENDPLYSYVVPSITPAPNEYDGDRVLNNSEPETGIEDDFLGRSQSQASEPLFPIISPTQNTETLSQQHGEPQYSMVSEINPPTPRRRRSLPGIAQERRAMFDQIRKTMEAKENYYKRKAIIMEKKWELDQKNYNNAPP